MTQAVGIFIQSPTNVCLFYITNLLTNWVSRKINPQLILKIALGYRSFGVNANINLLLTALITPYLL